MVFIVVRHGDKKETLFNANCRVATLLDNIKLRCGCDKTTCIDLCDDKGSMCRLEEHPKENGRKFTRERENYVLIRKEKVNGITRYSSLLNGLKISDPELLALIEGRNRQEEAANLVVHGAGHERRMSKALDRKSFGHALALKRKSRVSKFQ